MSEKQVLYARKSRDVLLLRYVMVYVLSADNRFPLASIL